MTATNHDPSDHETRDCCHGEHAEADSGKNYDKVPEGFDGTVYTCPMHPEVREPGPDDCPLCGMALERETVSLEPEDTSELDDMTRRMWVGAGLTVPIMILAMGGMIPGVDMNAWVPHRIRVWLELLLATPVVLWCGWPFLVRAVRSVQRRALNMFTLIGLGVSVAYVYSVVATVAPGIFPPSFRGDSGQVGVYFEAAAMIVTLVLLGQVMELRARSSTNRAIRSLLELAPNTARRVDSDGNEEDVPLDRVEVARRSRSLSESARRASRPSVESTADPPGELSPGLVPISCTFRLVAPSRAQAISNLLCSTSAQKLSTSLIAIGSRGIRKLAAKKRENKNGSLIEQVGLAGLHVGKP
jgi:Cu+-exporting ATPase